MIRGILTLARLDLLSWRRNPLAVTSALIPPITMTLLLLVLSLAVIQQPVALVVKGHGEQTEKMQGIVQSDTDAYINYDFTKNLKPIDAKSAEQKLNNQQVAAIITIPADFDKKVIESKGQVNLTLNNVDIDFSDDIRRSVDRSVAVFDAPSLALEEENAVDPLKNKDQQKAYQNNPYLIHIEESDIRETDVEWLSYQIIPALVLLVLSVGLIGTALLCARDIECKTARYLVVSPQQSWALVTGRLLGGFLASIIVLIPAILLCTLTGTIHPPISHWPALAAILAATALCAAGLGAILGSILKGSRNIAMASSVIATYMYFLGGGFTTISFLPQWLRNLSSFIPMRYAIDGMRQAMFYSTLDGVAKDLTILCLTAVFAIILGSYTIRRSWSN